MDEDITKLTDEELDKRLAGEEVIEETDNDEAPSTNEGNEPESEQESEVAEEEEPQEEVEEEVPDEVLSRRAKKRIGQLKIQELLAKRKEASPRREETKTPEVEPLDYRTALDADPEVIERLEQDRRSVADNRYEQGVLTAAKLAEERAIASEFRTNIKLDYALVKDKLDKLDPVDVNALDVEYLQLAGYDTETGLVANPNIGYADYVEARIEQAKRLASKLTEQTTRNIAKQAAQTGLRPDGTSSARGLNLNKAPEEMTDEELDAVLAQGGLATKKR